MARELAELLAVDENDLRDGMLLDPLETLSVRTWQIGNDLSIQ
jgi:hypothetical protein